MWEGVVFLVGNQVEKRKKLSDDIFYFQFLLRVFKVYLYLVPQRWSRCPVSFMCPSFSACLRINHRSPHPLAFPWAQSLGTRRRGSDSGRLVRSRFLFCSTGKAVFSRKCSFFLGSCCSFLSTLIPLGLGMLTALAHRPISRVASASHPHLTKVALLSSP